MKQSRLILFIFLFLSNQYSRRTEREVLQNNPILSSFSDFEISNHQTLELVAQRISTAFKLPFDSTNTRLYINDSEGKVMSLEELKAQLKNKHLLSPQQLHKDIAEALNLENFEAFRTPLNEEAFTNSVSTTGKRLCDHIVKAMEDDMFDRIIQGSMKPEPKTSVVFNNRLIESSIEQMINRLHPIETAFGVSLQTVWESLEDYLSHKIKVFTRGFLTDISHALLFIGQPSQFLEAELISVFKTSLKENVAGPHKRRIDLLLRLISKTQTHEESRSLFAFLVKLSRTEKSDKRVFIFKKLKSILELNYSQDYSEGAKLLRFLVPKFAKQVTICSSSRMVLNELILSEKSSTVPAKTKVALALTLNEGETLGQKNYEFLVQNLPLVAELKKEDFEIVEFALMFFINDLVESDTFGVEMVNTAFTTALAIEPQPKNQLCESFNRILDTMVTKNEQLNDQVYLYAKVINAVLSNSGYKRFALRFLLPDSESFSLKSLAVEVFKIDKLAKLLKDVLQNKRKTNVSKASSFESTLSSFREGDFQSTDFNFGSIEVVKTERKLSTSLPKKTSCVVDFQQQTPIEFLVVPKDETTLMSLNAFVESQPPREDLSASRVDAFDAILADVYLPKEESY